MELSYARQVVEHEARALASLAKRLDARFVRAMELVEGCRGRVVVSGMGKAGLIGTKISATLASTGTPSYFLHPAEALHGDLGRLVAEDVMLVLSNSGETDEVVRLIPHLKRIGTPLIAVTGRAASTLARHADVVLDIGDLDEACPLGLAPSTSTTAMLALGDALALGVQRARNLTPEEYARFHPGGSLGRKLLKVEEIMRSGAKNAVLPADRTVKEALFAITEARAGAVCLTDEHGRLAGIFTDGDLRRHVAADADVGSLVLRDVMTRNPRTIEADRLATEAARLMREYKIDELPVIDSEGRPIGLVDIQDLLAVGLI